MIIEWLQSFEGVTAITFSGISIGSIIGNAVLMFKLIKTGRSNAVIGNDLRNANESVKTLKEDSEKKDKILISQSKQIIQSNAITQMVLKVLSIIVVDSGIDVSTKLDLEKDIGIFKKQANDLVQEIITDTKETGIEVLEKVAKKAEQNAEESLDKVQGFFKKAVDKYKKGW